MILFSCPTFVLSECWFKRSTSEDISVTIVLASLPMNHSVSPSGSNERVDDFASERIEMQKYRDDEEVAERENDRLLHATSPGYPRARNSDGAFSRTSSFPSRRRVSHAQCSCIIFLSLILFVLLFALFGPSDRLRSYLPVPSSNGTNTTSPGFDIALIEDPCACGTKPFGTALCTSYTAPALDRSRLFSGTGARTRRFLDVARQRPVKVGILGGSVSACHGVDTDSMGKSCYARRIVDWMRQRLYGGNEEGVVAVNGAIGGMDSRCGLGFLSKATAQISNADADDYMLVSYYAFCGTHHVPLDVDLLILEFDVNDQPCVSSLSYDMLPF